MNSWDNFNLCIFGGLTLVCICMTIVSWIMFKKKKYEGFPWVCGVIFGPLWATLFGAIFLVFLLKPNNTVIVEQLRIK